MKLELGTYNTLTVLRETEFSFILGDEETEVFLHKRQATKTLDPGEEVEVFLYYDNQKRITATMKKPILDIDNPAFAEVVDVNFRLGVFLNIGLIKDLLLSRDDLPFIRKEWPKKGDKVFVKIKVAKNQMAAKIIPRYEIQNYLKPEKELEEGQTYTAYNVYKTEEGNVFFTEQGHYIYVYFKHMRKIHRFGEKVDVKITLVKENHNYNGSLIEQKELMMSKDAEYIRQYLLNKNGVMPFTDKSDPDLINETFRMSKSAFKRALGTLYKEKIVTLEKDKTILNDIDK